MYISLRCEERGLTGVDGHGAGFAPKDQGQQRFVCTRYQRAFVRRDSLSVVETSIDTSISQIHHSPCHLDRELMHVCLEQRTIRIFQI